MTNDKINAAIAEACGWRDLGMHPMFGLMGVNPNADGIRTAVEWYTDDLNAMHQVEKTLTIPQWYDYATYLNPMWTKEKLIHATAFQRAEAYLKTIGKWEGLQA